MSLFGTDLYANMPGVIHLDLGVGIAGLIATWWLLRWSLHPRRPKLARFIDDGMTGSSLRNAQAALDEVARFEQD
ncbi:MAG: hypothetical protein ABI843_04825 [Dokdonella sp.]